jgi:hypothetical protein
MAKDQMQFAHENTQRTLSAASFGADWMAQIVQHNLKQSRAAFDSAMTLCVKMADAMGEQATTIHEHSVHLAKQSVANTFDAADKMVRVKRPEELAEAQTQFLSSQANAFADLTAKLGERLAQQTNEIAKTAVNKAQERSEAA